MSILVRFFDGPRDTVVLVAPRSLAATKWVSWRNLYSAMRMRSPSISITYVLAIYALTCIGCFDTEGVAYEGAVLEGPTDRWFFSNIVSNTMGTGKPIAGATVTVCYLANGGEPRPDDCGKVGTTDAQGRYSEVVAEVGEVTARSFVTVTVKTPDGRSFQYRSKPQSELPVVSAPEKYLHFELAPKASSTVR
jgi:hypothetical protein